MLTDDQIKEFEQAQLDVARDLELLGILTVALSAEGAVIVGGGHDEDSKPLLTAIALKIRDMLDIKKDVSCLYNDSSSKLSEPAEPAANGDAPLPFDEQHTAMGKSLGLEGLLSFGLKDGRMFLSSGGTTDFARGLCRVIASGILESRAGIMKAMKFGLDAMAADAAQPAADTTAQ